MLDGAMRIGPARADCVSERFEIDMSGEVGGARRFEGIGVFVVLHRLQRIAGGAFRVTVVDHESRAAMRCNAGGDLFRDGCTRGRDFGSLALGRIARGCRKRRVARKRYGRKHWHEAFAVEPDITLAPALLRALVLCHRQGVEEFIGDEEEGQGRQGGDAVVPRRMRYAGFLRVAEHGARFDEMNLRRIPHAGNAADCTQEVGHQCASPGTEFGDGDAFRCALSQPLVGEP